MAPTKRELALGVAGLVGLSLLLARYALATEPMVDLPSQDQFQVVIDSGLPSLFGAVARESADDWNQMFSCGRSITIVPLAEHQLDIQGHTADAEERSFPGVISINPRYDAYDNTAHGMTHACKPDQPMWLETPIPLRDATLVGYHGLTLLVTLPGSSELAYFHLFEEGVAERNAEFVSHHNNHRYVVSAEPYFNLGNLTLDLFPESNTDTDDYVKDHNVPEFVRTVLDLPADQPITGNEIDEAIDIYQAAFDRGLN